MGRALGDRSGGLPFPVLAKVLLCAVGLALFATNPWRDLWFYEDVAAHEGFGTVADAYIIGFAFQLMATILMFPVALILIICGIGRAKRFSLRPRFDRFTWGWGILASMVSLLMALIEAEGIAYCIRYTHHLDTVAIASAYIAFIYVWWCCSLAHGKPSAAYAP